MSAIARVGWAGEAALLVELGPPGIDEAINARVHALARLLDERALPGVTDLVPGFWNLLIELEPSCRAGVLREVRGVLGTNLGAIEPVGREIVIPVCYGGADGPDLEAVAGETGLATREVVRLHHAREYRAFAVGFTPGFPYLGPLDSRLRVERLAGPRPRVPAGSVAIAGDQTGVYPVESPGGWQLIGRSLRRIYDANRPEPFLVAPGDRVRFRPATPDDSLEAAAPAAPDELAGRPALRVLRAGLLDTLQDLGRPGVGRFGLARAGALDGRAIRRANALVGNPASAATLELTLVGPTLEVLAPLVVAVAGGGPGPVLKSRPVERDRSFAVREGDTLKFLPGPAARSWLAVAGGLSGRSFGGSVSTDLRAGVGGHGGRAVRSGDVLRASEPTRAPLAGFGFSPQHRGGRFVWLRLSPGPQARALDAAGWRRLTGETYRVIAADRTGIRLDGPALEPLVPGIISEGVPLGSLQVPPDGLPILLLADAGRLGGYPKPAVLRRADLPLAASLREGDRVRFRLG